MLRAGLLLLLSAALAPAWAESVWVESVEFPWNAFPRSLWERELAWLKNIGIRHVSLPPTPDAAELAGILRILRSLDLEADLEGPVPDALLPLTRAHGGPLTAPLAGAVRISALAPDALTHSRKLLTSGKTSLIWTDVEETFSASSHHAGAVNFAGVESAATGPLRRNAQLSKYWGETLGRLKETPLPQPAPGILLQQFGSETGLAFVSIVNTTSRPWTGDVKLKRLVIPAVMVPAHDSAWLPVHVTLLAGPLCKDCTAFAKRNHLVYSTAELTAMEYENGILAMEFSAPAKGEVLLQLSSEPRGPLVAGGRPAEVTWDDKTQRVRLPIPAGTGVGHHVRIGLAIEAPDATAFFTSAHVLLIGETNHLTAEFSSEAIAQRSRLRTTPEFAFTQDPTKEPLQFIYNIKVPETAIHGDEPCAATIAAPRDAAVHRYGGRPPGSKLGALSHAFRGAGKSKVRSRSNGFHSQQRARNPQFPSRTEVGRARVFARKAGRNGRRFGSEGTVVSRFRHRRGAGAPRRRSALVRRGRQQRARAVSGDSVRWGRGMDRGRILVSRKRETAGIVPAR